jgi:hypothetical protein
MVNLTTRAPGIVTAILDETVPPDVAPGMWEEQQGRIAMPL